MISEENIIDLSDFAERDIKEEFTRLKDSISVLEKLIDAKDLEQPEENGNIAKQLKSTIRENIEEISLPIEQKCDVLEAKLNGIQETLNQVKLRQEIKERLLVLNTIGLGIIFVIYILNYIGI
ncbi:hypothetical protein SAMN05421493_101184 [Pseudobutyrivibrio sp. 49]|uniref:hypothetical protein n=1 Tax=unclassified Pseudobutyrivibrio TaxID=2638619 RepID=UPI0008915373|nr:MULTISPECIES: hypothetical protein [unclassified Pseudobutyrivibrio]SDH29897.1 hypothetical protein SAMN05421493_101184 [Pseudobutyrivibrio sp. 49]SFN51355.1 hypothetical protein SAMN04487831_101499 [Pseudobutyrivibrio sp. UC1225]